MKLKLKTTNELIHDLPYVGTGTQPWPSDYRRVLILRKPTNAIQIIHKNKIKEVKPTAGEM